MAVTLLGAWTLEASTRNSAVAFTPPAGTDRVIVAVDMSRGGGVSLPTTAIDFGGQAATQVEAQASTQGADIDTGIWILDEADIAAASANEFNLSPDSTGAVFRFFVAVYEGVDQTSPLVDNFSDVGISEVNPPSQAMTTVADGLAVVALIANQSTGPGGVGDADAAYVNLTERLELLDSSNYVSIADAVTTGTSFTSNYTLSHDQAGHVLALALRPADVTSTVAAGIEFNGSANASVFGAASASGSLEFNGTAQATRIIPASTTAAGIRFNGAAGASRNLPASTTAAGIEFNGTANGSRLIVASSVAAGITVGGTANASEFTGARAEGTIAFGGTANASPPVPIIPPTPIEDSFNIAQRPVILVNLFFDSGEVNIWTRPNVGIFAQKEYSPLAGITSGITVRNSLGRNLQETALELSGQSPELLAIALSENYINRRAEVILGNIGADGEIEAIETILTGTIVNMPVIDDESESIVSVVIESVFRSLARPTVVRLSSSDLALTSSDDSFFDFIETSSVTEPAFGGT